MKNIIFLRKKAVLISLLAIFMVCSASTIVPSVHGSKTNEIILLQSEKIKEKPESQDFELYWESYL